MLQPTAKMDVVSYASCVTIHLSYRWCLLYSAPTRNSYTPGTSKTIEWLARSEWRQKRQDRVGLGDETATPGSRQARCTIPFRCSRENWGIFGYRPECGWAGQQLAKSRRQSCTAVSARHVWILLPTTHCTWKRAFSYLLWGRDVISSIECSTLVQRSYKYHILQ